MDLAWLKALLQYLFINLYAMFYVGLLVLVCVYFQSWLPLILGLTPAIAIKYYILRRRERNLMALQIQGEYIKNWEPEKAIQEYINIMRKCSGNSSGDKVK